MITGSSNADMTDGTRIEYYRAEPKSGPLVIISVLLLLLLHTSCENDIEVIQSFEGDSLLPSQSMINAVIDYTDSARLQLRITAPEIHNYMTPSENYTEFPAGVLAQFFDRAGDIESYLNSKYAIYYTDKGLWEAKDSVVVVNKEGEKLNTEQLFWDEKNQLIYSNRFVKVTRPGEIITGEGFEADETFSRWKIKKIQGTIYLHDEEDS
jgi:LPS export ABC transporter protein LptC